MEGPDGAIRYDLPPKDLHPAEAINTVDVVSLCGGYRDRNGPRARVNVTGVRTRTIRHITG